MPFTLPSKGLVFVVGEKNSEYDIEISNGEVEKLEDNKYRIIGVICDLVVEIKVRNKAS